MNPPEELYSEGVVNNFEHTWVKKDGSLIEIEMNMALLKDEHNNVTGAVSGVREITERKQAEAALIQSEATIRNKLKAILEPEGDIGALELTDIIDTNFLQSIIEDFYQLTGMGGAVLDISGNVLVAVGWADICTKFHRVHPESCKNCIESDTLLTQGLASGTFKSYHCKNHMWDVVTPLVVGGRHLGNVFIGQFFYKDEIPDVELFREQARKYGFDEAEYLAALEKAPRFSREEVNTGMRFYSKLAEIISTLSFSAIQQSRMIVEQKQSKAALQDSEAKFRSIFSQAAVGVARVATDGTWLAVNQKLCDILGYSQAEMLSKTFQEITHPDDLQTDLTYIDQLLNDQIQTYSMNKRYFKKEGTEVWINLTVSLVRDQQNDPNYFISIIEDITERKQLEEENKKNRSMLQKAAELSNQGAWECDILSDQWSFSDNWLRIHGCSVSGISREQLMKLAHPDDAPRVERSFQDALAGREDYRFELRIIRQNDKEVRFVSVLGEVVRDDMGVPVKMWGVSQDITEHKQSEDALTRYRWLLEKEQGIKTQSVEPAYEDVTALNHDGLILKFVGADTLKQMSGDVMDLLDTSQAVYEKNGDYAFGTFVSGWCGTLDNASCALCETDDNRKALDCGKWLCHDSCWKISKNAIDSGEPVDEACCGGLHIYALPIFSGNQIIGAINFGYGTPPQTAAEQKELAEIYQLDLKTVQHNAEAYKPRPPFIINAAKRRLQSIARLIGEIVERKKSEEALQKKTDELIRFNYTVSHDLRSPLVTIQTFLGYIDQALAGGDMLNVTKDMHYIHSAADKMNALLDDLLQLSRIGYIDNPLVKSSLQDLVQEVLDLVAGRIAKGNIQVEVIGEPVVLYGDRSRLVEVFQNLIDNAAKFMGPQVEPKVEIGAEIKDGEIVMFVRDNGMGIDPQHKDKLFRLFEKLNPEAEGTGIGLVLVKRIVEVHGGRIWAESKGLGKGTCFWVALPQKGSESRA